MKKIEEKLHLKQTKKDAIKITKHICETYETDERDC